MIRLRIVSSDRVDQDVESHLCTLDTLPRVQIDRHPVPLSNELPLIVRTAAKLWRREQPDIAVTVGEAALVATMIAWRGPLVHLPVGRLTRVERSLLRWRGNASHTAAVFSSYLAAGNAIRRGIASEQVRVIRTAPPATYATRDEIRARLGIDSSAICALLCGRIHRRGGHRLTLLTSAALSFRDAGWRVLIDPGDQGEYVRRFSTNTCVPGTLQLCDQCSASELAAASDVAMVDDGATPSLVAIASAAQHRVPIVSSPRLWQREQLMHVPAMLVADGKARSWAKAAIESVEGAQAADMDRLETSLSASHDPRALTHQWLEVLHAVCGQTKAEVA
jgi:hypothetical protein